MLWKFFKIISLLTSHVQEEEESFSEQAAPSQPSEPQQTPAQAPRKHFRNREHFATIRTASLVRLLATPAPVSVIPLIT